ncbi:hypothetical protein ABIE21_003283 [Conyzicola nivalis]|uniref:Uncharacterized protein n=1 Tax=Conyzicola nivalis TaxID=1477021 RepID=A0ABV2QTI2_9MICO
MTSAFSWVDLVSLLVALVSLGVTAAIFFVGRRLSFRQQRDRAREMEAQAWKILRPIRLEGLNSKIIVMNVARYRRGYNGSNNVTLRGGAYSGAEIIEIVHGGIEVITQGVSSYYATDGRRTLTVTDQKAPNVIEVGHIPWEWIEDIVPEGDGFDGAPIVFVNHRAAGRRPYNFVTYKEGVPVAFGPNGRDYYRPVSELGTLRPPFLRDWWRFLKFWWQTRRRERLSLRAFGNPD